MQILHKDGFTEEQLREFKPLIYSNVFNSMASILVATKSMGILLKNEALDPDAELVIKVVDTKMDNLSISTQMCEAIKNLWKDPGVLQCYERRSEFQLTDGAKYFLDSVERISDPSFTPSHQDALCLRVATSGIVQIVFKAKNTEFRVFDVGGQRSERRKWIHCFDNVNSMIFVCALSEYDQVLREDHTTNRMLETLTLFSTITNCEYFIKIMIILFLNKKDLFAEKIKATSIKAVFPEYTGAQSYEEVVPYIKGKFRELNQNPKRTIKVHETCATDTNQVKLVINGVLEAIIKENMKDAGVM